MSKAFTQVTLFFQDQAQKLQAAGMQLARMLMIDRPRRYRPEAHYMRGPGPKWREKNAISGIHRSR